MLLMYVTIFVVLHEGRFFLFFPKQTQLMTLQKGVHLKTDEINTFQSIAEENKPPFRNDNQCNSFRAETSKIYVFHTNLDF